MPKYYCDYCDIFLTHDSSSVRKAHNAGRNHLVNVKTYYSELSPETTQSVVDTINRAYAESGTALPPQYSGFPQFGGPGGVYNPYRPPSYPALPPGMPPMRPGESGPNGLPPRPPMPPHMFMRPPPGAPPGQFPPPPPGFPAGAPFPPPGAPFAPPGSAPFPAPASGAPFPPPGQFPPGQFPPGQFPPAGQFLPPGAPGAPGAPPGPPGQFRPPFASIPSPTHSSAPPSGAGSVMNGDRKRRLEED
ncbi:hypothetical protein BGZ80_003035 [Entomortierella chlamydospora]|uniref:U1 small nuclear ribonucleoprotein C n=1 Tax=Entomortierella chlamydospora TaxID=101097 RepID=A0A9P6N2F3_9FUNG|nr:hypothetical protein BGZ80_003035 [Entomortierella chlamydospora]